MSVLIKGMKMPKNCADCDLEQCDENYYGDQSNFQCPLGYKAYTKKTREIKRLENCPLIEVSEHGDLIDREPFIEFIKKNWDSYDQWFIGQLEARPIVIPANKDSET